MEEGNREYKLKLLRPSSSRLTHLATQLHWRLNESPKGEAVYLLGVRDDGHPEGLAEGELRESLATLRRMARGVKARVLRVRVGPGVTGRVAEVLLRREESRWVDCITVAVVVEEKVKVVCVYSLLTHNPTTTTGAPPRRSCGSRCWGGWTGASPRWWAC